MYLNIWFRWGWFGLPASPCPFWAEFTPQLGLGENVVKSERFKYGLFGYTSGFL